MIWAGNSVVVGAVGRRSRLDQQITDTAGTTTTPCDSAWLLPFGIALAGFCWAFSAHVVTLQHRLIDADEFLRMSARWPSRRLGPFNRWRSAGKNKENAIHQKTAVHFRLKTAHCKGD
jgi:hypothetical protein